MQNLASLAAEPKNAGVVNAIHQAASRSGVDFSYLLQKAQTESSLNPTAKASTSSASGLYQFIDQTWLTEMAQHGGEYGLSAQAGAISIDSGGHASVADSSMRGQIMALKNDPTVAAEMAASFTKDNQATLQAAGIGTVGPTELYLAHFLGAGGATRFLSAMKSDAGQSASAILPQAADANEPIFFHADGSARSLGEIYNRFAAKFTGSVPVAAPAVATAPATVSAAASAAYANAASFISGMMQTGSATVIPSPDGAGETGASKDSLYEMILFSQLTAMHPNAEKKPLNSDQTL